MSDDIQTGFFHPDQGYWVCIGPRVDEMRKQYPEGTIEVPLRPTPLHTYDPAAGAWEPPSQEVLDALAAEEVRRERDALLGLVVDPVVSNPLRWAAMSAEQQQAWADYRTALLDVPQQAGFPHDVTWPSKPE